MDCKTFFVSFLVYNELNNNLKASDNTLFRFGVDADGKYGYIVTDSEGADTVIPFKSKIKTIIQETVVAVTSANGGGYQYQNFTCMGIIKSIESSSSYNSHGNASPIVSFKDNILTIGVMPNTQSGIKASAVVKVNVEVEFS